MLNKLISTIIIPPVVVIGSWMPNSGKVEVCKTIATLLKKVWFK